MLIGISGKKQCGKDTICKMIRALDDRWEKHAFADKLKQALAVILDVKVEAFEDNIFKMSDSTIAKPEGGSIHIENYFKSLELRLGGA